MSRRPTPPRDEGPLAPRAVRLRNSCLEALSRRTSRRPPTSVELAKIRSDLGLREAWDWWATLDSPTQLVRPISRRSARRGDWKRAAIVLLATGAWLIVPAVAAVAVALVPIG